MRAMRYRQTGKAFHQRIVQEEKSRLSANAIKRQDSSQLNSDEALRNATIEKSGTGRPLPGRAAINQVIEEQKQLSPRLRCSPGRPWTGLASKIQDSKSLATRFDLRSKTYEECRRFGEGPRTNFGNRSWSCEGKTMQ